MSFLPYILSEGLWHKIDDADASRLVCGATAPKESDSAALTHRPTICAGCEKAFPAASLVSTHEANMRLWKAAISCAVTEDKREEVMRFHKLAVAAAHALGVAETRLAYETGIVPPKPPEAKGLVPPKTG
jgi:hypothetical protein